MTTHVYEFSCDCCESVVSERVGKQLAILSYEGKGPRQREGWDAFGAAFGMSAVAIKRRVQMGVCLHATTKELSRAAGLKRHGMKRGRGDEQVMQALAARFCRLKWV